MKKIIAAIDGLKYGASTTDYAVHLAKKINAHLVGVFLDDFTYHSYKIYELVEEDGVSVDKLERFEEKDKETREESENRFEAACQHAGLNYGIHHDRNVAIQELLHESIYADLLVVHSHETLTHYEEKIPTRFIRDLLSEVRCPVLIVPKEYRPIDEVVLLCDGQPSSVFAIRMFSYVFPSLKYLPTEVLSVNSEREGMHLPDHRLMKEFMKRHYPKATYNVIKGVPETEIVRAVKQKGKNTVVVMGAYRRGMVSRWFRPSMADVLMEELNLPLFIAHS
jgi:nucleotide-binding universal stress UspA family protein